jgi:N-acetylglucosaminyl-diphospho-decaprenol L-rhamnosyltransferase
VVGADIVIVSYNSADVLRRNVEALCGIPGVSVFVVDNQSSDGSLETIADLPATGLQMSSNRGFAAGCNAGWRAGSAPYVLFLNPDARIDGDSLSGLVTVLSDDPDAGVVGPRIVTDDGSLDFSQRRFPRLRSTYARALFLHRIFPDAAWTDEMIRQVETYEEPRAAEWLSGACLLVRRELLETLGGWDESFFMYCEDKDLCRRAWAAGYAVRYEPSATCLHVGGASAPRASLLPVLAASRLRYVRKHASGAVPTLERLGLALEALIRIAVSGGGSAARAGHARSLRVLIRNP